MPITYDSVNDYIIDAERETIFQDASLTLRARTNHAQLWRRTRDGNDVYVPSSCFYHLTGGALSSQGRGHHTPSPLL